VVECDVTRGDQAQPLGNSICLHAALAPGARRTRDQKGSLVDSQRLRFDFANFEPIKPEQIRALERTGQRAYRMNTPAAD